MGHGHHGRHRLKRPVTLKKANFHSFAHLVLKSSPLTLCKWLQNDPDCMWQRVWHWPKSRLKAHCQECFLRRVVQLTVETGSWSRSPFFMGMPLGFGNTVHDFSWRIERIAPHSHISQVQMIKRDIKIVLLGNGGLLVSKGVSFLSCNRPSTNSLRSLASSSSQRWGVQWPRSFIGLIPSSLEDPNKIRGSISWIFKIWYMLRVFKLYWVLKIGNIRTSTLLIVSMLIDGLFEGWRAMNAFLVDISSKRWTSRHS